jgi:hypothetical protein
MVTYPLSVTVKTTAYKRGRVLDNEQVVSMTTVVPGRPDVVATFPTGTKLDSVFRLMGDRYTFVGQTTDTTTKSGTVVISRRYARTGGGSGSGNGHKAGA